MPKRLTSTEKWADPWFRGLTPGTKHLWQWLLDHCDIAGVIRPDFGLAAFQIGQAVNEENIAELGDRVKAMEGGKLLVVKFVAFQFGELSDSSLVHRSVIKALASHGLPIPNPLARDGQEIAKGYPMDKGCPSLKVKVKVKEKVQEGVQGEERMTEFPAALNTSRIQNKWQVWMNHRRAFKKPKSWLVMFNEQIEWLSKFSEEDAFEILSVSIRNGYQGLFEPKMGGGNGKTGNVDAKEIKERISIKTL